MLDFSVKLAKKAIGFLTLSNWNVTTKAKKCIIPFKFQSKFIFILEPEIKIFLVWLEMFIGEDLIMADKRFVCLFILCEMYNKNHLLLQIMPNHCNSFHISHSGCAANLQRLFDLKRSFLWVLYGDTSKCKWILLLVRLECISFVISSDASWGL